MTQVAYSELYKSTCIETIAACILGICTSFEHYQSLHITPTC